MDRLQLLNKIAKAISKIGGETYFVGGYVRDKIREAENKDIDVEIYNITPDQLRKILSKFGTVDTVGSSFGILNLHGVDIDFAQPRTEKCTGRGHKDFDVYIDPFIDKENACRRRDFTMNALMQNVLTGEIFDFFGGIDDINNGIIRHIDDETFIEDPLRVLRACQFASRFEYTIAPETMELMKDIDLSNLPKERIFEEVKKALLKSEKPSHFFNLLRECGHTELFPELYVLDTVEQNPHWHPEGNAYKHTMQVLDNTSLRLYDKDFKLLLAAICHDMGKAITSSVDENGNIHHYRHEIAGLPIAEKFLHRITDDKYLIKYVCDMVKNHMRIHNAFDNNCKNKVYYKIFYESIDPVNLIVLSAADSPQLFEYCISGEKFENYIRYKNSHPMLSGKDLIEMGYTPNKQFSEILDFGRKLWFAGTPLTDIKKTVRGTYKCNS